jgi:hypothetical protein
MRPSDTIKVVQHQQRRLDESLHPVLNCKLSLDSAEPPQMGQEVTRPLHYRVVGRVEPLRDIRAQRRLASTALTDQPSPVDTSSALHIGAQSLNRVPDLSGDSSEGRGGKAE